jgi:DNA-binding transcriptional MerR regulator
MTDVLKKYSAGRAFGAFAAMNMPHMPRIAFEKPDDLGNGAGDNNGGGSDDNSGSDDSTGGSDDDAAGDDDTSGSDKSEADKALLREVMEKKGKIKDLTGEVSTLKAELKRFEGINLDEVRALIDEKKNAELQAEEAKGNFDRVKQMMVEAHENDKKTLTDTIADLQTQLQKANGQIDELTVGRSFSESKYIVDELVLTPAKARQLYGAHFGIEDGQVVAYDKPTGADARTVYTGGDGKPLAFEDAMKKLIEADPDRDRLVKSNIKPGAGSATKKVEDKTDKTGADKTYGVSRILFSLNKEDK